MSQLEKLADKPQPRPRPEPLTDRDALMREILDQPIRTDQDYLELLRTLTKEIVDEATIGVKE
jgi:hypothetical protein